MTVSTLLKTIVIKHDRHGPFKFEIYVTDGLYHADISYKNGSGHWADHQNDYGFGKANCLEDAEASCQKFIVNYGK